LTNATSRSVEVLSADLGSKDDVSRIEDLLRNNGSISMLANNAGIAGVGPLLASDPDRMEAMSELNVTALMRLTYAIAPKFVERGNGTTINISSIVVVGSGDPERRI
jgi:short-subunit dehydrogenase